MSLLSRLAVTAARAYGILSSNKNNVTTNFLVVAGGGGGGAGNITGGGGAGGFRTSAGTSGGGASAESTITLSTLNTYTIIVGAGGAGGPAGNQNNGFTGFSSSISGTGLTTITSVGGGNGGGDTTVILITGGSGGGSAGVSNGPGSGTANQGYNGGRNWGTYGGGGGGGAGAAGGGVSPGNGGNGVASSISGSSVTYGGGGGAGGQYLTSGTYGAGGTGGGGNGGTGGGNNVGLPGTANTGGGGGGAAYVSSQMAGGAGGSGIVIISYASATPRFTGGTITTSGGNQIHTFTATGTLSPLTPVTASYLVVAGGGASGSNLGGGGGAGGLLTSSTTLYSGATYIVTVGAGGAAPAYPPDSNGNNGSNSSLAGTGLTTLTAIGGGGGGKNASGLPNAGSGGSGGGCGEGITNFGTGTSGQGNNGGQSYDAGGAYGAGGGGGSGAVGSNGTVSTGGAGGVGTASSISGTSTYYAGGGGGAGIGASGAGGLGGGGASVTSGAGVTGTANTGGGAGGSNSSNAGVAGGSGIVIISYAGSQVFNGGLVTSSGGNTIHTFLSSGALTPLTNNLNNSLRFRASASAYLNRTPTVAGNRRTWTWSAWVKRGKLGDETPLFQGYVSGTDRLWIGFDTGNTLQMYGSSGTIIVATSAVFRDPSAWYHVVVAFDTTQATAANRVKLYVNGNQQAIGTGTYPSLNAEWNINNTVSHQIGSSNNTVSYYDGYMTDINFIDGQALEPYYFGNNDAYGNWKPILYKGTYGTNGFYLPFISNTSLTAYGGTYNGSSTSVVTPSSSAFAYGTGDFTIETIMFIQGAPSTDAGIIDGRPTSTNGAYFSLLLNSSLQPFIFVNSATKITGPVLTAYTFYHLAYVRTGGLGTLYVNGVSVGSWNDNTTYLTTTITLGRHTSGGAYLNGFLSNVRIVKGTAVYTQQFTPPTSSLTAITNTQLLTMQSATVIDNSTNAFTLTNNGPVTMSSAYVYTGIFATDQSGNANNWLPTNFYTNIGYATSSYDIMLDVPTNTSATVANYAVLNPLAVSASTGTCSNGNLTSTGIATGGGNSFATIALPASGKFYWEATPTTITGDGMIGLSTVSTASSFFWQNTDGSIAYYNGNGNKYINNSATAYGATWTTNDVIGVAVDLDAGTVTFYKNNTSQGAITFNASGLFPAVSDASIGAASVFQVNFGQRPFSYTPPTGYVALNTYNLPDSTIPQGNKYMDASLYTGQGVVQTVVNAASFQPDLVWIKSRSAATDNKLTDSVRGATKALVSNSTAAETTDLTGMTAFNTNGFTVGASTTYNNTSATYVGWQWQAGQGSSSSNTSGSLTSTVSVNTTAGFSVCTFNTGSSGNQSFGHGLGVAPKFVILKDRVNSGNNWVTFHASVCTSTSLFLGINTTSGVGSAAGIWGASLPDSTKFYLGSGTALAAGNNSVAYCWAEIAGFSKFGSYTGNGSADGPFVYTGFRPKFVMLKGTGASAANWNIFDTSRDTYNVEGQFIAANTSSMEGTSATLDGLSNGFKIKTSGAYANTNGETFIYMAFAENPFKNANAR